MNMGRRRSRGRPGISRDRMTAECELSVNGVIIGRGGLKRGRQERLAGVPVLMTATGDMFSACDKIATRLVRRGTHTGPYGGIEAPASGPGHGLCRLAVPVGTVDEISTIPDPFALLMKIGNLPDEAVAGVAEPRPVPARRRSGARTCYGGRRHRSGPCLPLSLCALRRAVRPGYARGRRQCRASSFLRLGETFLGQRGS